MDSTELARHLRDNHDFEAHDGSSVRFLRGIHHGLHVQAGRDRTEQHLHEIHPASA